MLEKTMASSNLFLQLFSHRSNPMTPVISRATPAYLARHDKAIAIEDAARTQSLGFSTWSARRYSPKRPKKIKRGSDHAIECV
jgi:hypothetical protein